MNKIREYGSNKFNDYLDFKKEEKRWNAEENFKNFVGSRKQKRMNRKNKRK